MRRPVASIRGEGGRDFENTQLEDCGLDHHLGGKLHAGGAQVHTLESVFAKSAKAAVKISYRAMEKEASDPGQGGIPEILVQRRHGILLNAAAKPVPHYDVGARPQLLQESRDMGEVVAFVGVSHDNVFAGSGGDAAHQGAAISLALHPYDPGAKLFRNFH